MRSLRRKVLLSESLSPLKNRLMNGGNVIDENFKKITVEKQLDNICQILGGEVKHYTCCDRTTEHQKIVIEYNHKKK
jgi:hypothetical protein